MKMEQNNSYNPNASVDITLNRDLQKHEQTKLKEQHGFELSRLDKDNAHVQELEKTKLGLIGRLFGTGDNSSKNITAIICFLLIIGGAAISLYAYVEKNDKDLATSVWSVIAPIITLSLGYLFGKK